MRHTHCAWWCVFHYWQWRIIYPVFCIQEQRFSSWWEIREAYLLNPLLRWLFETGNRRWLFICFESSSKGSTCFAVFHFIPRGTNAILKKKRKLSWAEIAYWRTEALLLRCDEISSALVVGISEDRASCWCRDACSVPGKWRTHGHSHRQSQRIVRLTSVHLEKGKGIRMFICECGGPERITFWCLLSCLSRRKFIWLRLLRWQVVFYAPSCLNSFRSNTCLAT